MFRNIKSIVQEPKLRPEHLHVRRKFSLCVRRVNYCRTFLLDRRRREADSERWWTNKLLGVLEEQVDRSCDDFGRVRSEITRTREMLNREAANAKINAGPCVHTVFRFSGAVAITNLCVAFDPHLRD